MSVREALENSFESVKKTGRQQIPERVQKALIEFSKDPENESTLNKMVALITRHTEMLNTPQFKFTTLPIHWPRGEDAPLYYYDHAIRERSLNTEMLAKDGVAVYFGLTNGGKFVWFNMEDMKGRTQTLARFELDNPGNQKVQLMNGDVTAVAVDICHFSTMHSPHNDDLKKRIKQVVENSVLINVPLSHLNQYKNLWFCRKEGVSNPFSNKKLIPINSSASSPSVHAQINKLDPSLINHLSNAARRGPTINTLQTIYESALQSASSQVTGQEFIELMQAATRQIKPQSCQATLPLNYLKQADNPSLSIRKKAEIVVTGLLSTGVMFDKKATNKRLYNSIDAPRFQSNRRASSSGNTKSNNDSIGNDSGALRETFEQYHKALTPEQLAHKMLQALHPDGLLPLSADDIQTLNQIASSMQRSPRNATHGLNWFEGIVRDRQLAMLEKPSTPKSESPELDRSRGPRR